MHLNDILSNAEDQDRGRWFDLVDPVTGKATGIRFLVAGPDSATQSRARLRMVDDLAEAADDEGKVSAAAREKCRLNSLARCILGWEIVEDGEALPFNQANVLRVLRAAQWVRQQVDAMAGDRAPFMRGR
ncbi:MAG TPA: hypothetical protein VNQ78_06955 [Paracoccus sp. (in: a-proteobacteria)]|uniref:hypothetical protein n=1 Tax=Paracoccus sp. TaxID=267 RepID=UPI002BD5BCF0|nr:hypothetical protein [Paracoccus sp. (in: a-proteobacteria)]HWL56404.1 hypothetical protein [Paracoccus sp. (in: a-proteobacteria)]